MARDYAEGCDSVCGKSPGVIWKSDDMAASACEDGAKCGWRCDRRDGVGATRPTSVRSRILPEIDGRASPRAAEACAVRQGTRSFHASSVKTRAWSLAFRLLAM